MDVVDFWSKQVKLWNDNTKCGLCWTFSAPLYESSVENYRIREEDKCCVHVMLVNPSFNTQRNYDSITGLNTTINCNESFQLLFLMPSQIDINNFNELPGHSIEESKWFTVFNRLKQCIECDAEIDFCTILGSRSRITNWSASLLPQNYTSNNYAGYRLSVTFQNIR